MKLYIKKVLYGRFSDFLVSSFLSQTWLHVQSCLELGGTVDGVGGGPGRGEGSAGLGQVAQSVVRLALQQLDLHQQGFVIHLLQLLEQLGTWEGGREVGKMWCKSSLAIHLFLKKKKALSPVCTNTTLCRDPLFVKSWQKQICLNTHRAPRPPGIVWCRSRVRSVVPETRKGAIRWALPWCWRETKWHPQKRKTLGPQEAPATLSISHYTVTDCGINLPSYYTSWQLISRACRKKKGGGGARNSCFGSPLNSNTNTLRSWWTTTAVVNHVRANAAPQPRRIVWVHGVHTVMRHNLLDPLFCAAANSPRYSWLWASAVDLSAAVWPAETEWCHHRETDGWTAASSEVRWHLSSPGLRARTLTRQSFASERGVRCRPDPPWLRAARVWRCRFHIRHRSEWNMLMKASTAESASMLTECTISAPSKTK